MVDGKLSIALNCEEFENEMIYVAIAFKGGTTTKYFTKNNNEDVVVNYAFFNILFQYWKLFNNMNECSFEINRSSSVIAFSSTKKMYMNLLKEFFSGVYNVEYDNDFFLKAKEDAIISLKKIYKSAEFRGRYKILEISDKNKSFNLDNMIDDLKNIDYEGFIKCVNNCIVPGNTFLYINGKVDDGSIIYNAIEPYLSNSHFLNIKNISKEITQDLYIHGMSKEECSYSTLYFEFEDKEVTNSIRHVFLDFAATLLGNNNVEVYVDSSDSSVTFKSEAYKMYKNLLKRDISREEFEVIRKKIYAKYFMCLKKRPDKFAMLAADMMSRRINIIDYLKFYEYLTFEVYKDLLSSVSYNIIEGQVIMSKEVK